MSTYEERIRQHVDASTNNRVLLEVTPIYGDGNDTFMPTHIRMVAIDQDGNVMFDVKIPNGLLKNHSSGCCNPK